MDFSKEDLDNIRRRLMKRLAYPTILDFTDSPISIQDFAKAVSKYVACSRNYEPLSIVLSTVAQLELSIHQLFPHEAMECYVNHGVGDESRILKGNYGDLHGLKIYTDLPFYHYGKDFGMPSQIVSSTLNDVGEMYIVVRDLRRGGNRRGLLKYRLKER